MHHCLRELGFSRSARWRRGLSTLAKGNYSGSAMNLCVLMFVSIDVCLVCFASYLIRWSGEDC